MLAVTRNANTVESAVILDWIPFLSPENGDSAITSYNLQWFKENAWADLYGMLPGATLI